MIRMNSFKSYMSEKYPTYSDQRKLIGERRVNTNNLDAENIEKSLRHAENVKEMMDLKRSNEASKAKQAEEKRKPLPRLKTERIKRTRPTPLKEPLMSKSMVVSSRTARRDPELEGYEMDEGRTRSPITWRRPISNTTLMVKKMMDEAEKTEKSRNEGRLDKEIFFEAIYREDLAGQIFMKYLITRNKSVI